MKRAIVREFSRLIVLIGLVGAGVAGAADLSQVDRVTVKDGKVLAIQAGQTLPVESDLTLPGEIIVRSNAVFTVKGGKERPLREGQALQKDGMLLSPDGSLVPVVDHIVMRAGQLTLVKDGDASPLKQETVLGDGTRIRPDGTYLQGGVMKRMLDGQLFRLEGGIIPAKDTITLVKGKVTVQKDGSSFTLRPGQNVAMNDGSRVNGDGYYITQDGRRVTLVEGQIITVEGVVKR